MSKTVTYLGFAGHGNLGDDAIREVYAERLPDRVLWNMPVRKADIARGLVRGDILRHRGAPVLLGGGTVLGRTIWRHHIGRTMRWMKPSKAVLLGAGVEDPEFTGDASYTSWDELKLWPEIIDQFATVSVRGPRSREILAHVGVEAELVGDPALLLGREVLTAQINDDGPILVNLTHGEDQWGGKSLDWSPPVVDCLRELVRSGRRVEFVSMEIDDVAINERASAALGGGFTHHRPVDTDALLDLLYGARLVVGTRLHMCVLGIAAGVPTMSLEYRPKCRDFMASVDAEEFCLRVDRLDADALGTTVDSLLARSGEQLTSQNARVEELRSLLTLRFGSLQESL